MTYAEFLLCFLILPIGAMLGGIHLARKWGYLHAVNLSYHWRGVAILAVIAFLWTTPWDNYLIAREVWNSPPDRIIGRVFYVPIEEYAFFLLMPIFNGAVLICFLGRVPATASTWREPQTGSRITAALIAVVILCAGLIALRYEEGTYLGLIVVWFLPPVAIQWLFDPAAFLRARGIVGAGTLVPVVYFGFADSLAIREGTWVISETSTTGLELLNVPIEEILFFAVTSLLLAQGLVLWHSLCRSKGAL